MNPELSDIGHLILENAKSRWLHPEEIFLLLLRPTELNFNVQSRYLTTPKAGDLIIFNQTKTVKDDGIEWAKKKDNSRLQETYMKIKINDVELIQGVYVKAASDELFKRRIYKLIHTSKTGKYYQVVHYRYDVDDSKAKGLDENIHLLVYQYLKQEKMYQQFDVNNQQAFPSSAGGGMMIDNGLKEEKEMFPSSGIETSPYSNTPDQLQTHPTCDLIDFAPQFMFSGLGADMEQSLLVILSQNFNEMTPIKIRFVHESNFSIDTVAVFLTPHVVKCMIPNELNLGSWQLFLLNSATNNVYGCTKTVFEVLESPQIHVGGGREYEMLEDDQMCILGKRNHSSPRKPYGGSGSGGGGAIFPQSESEEQYDPDRQCKIRFVERLSSFRQSTMGVGANESMQIETTNLPETASNNGPTSYNSIRRPLEHSSSSTFNPHWLDDQELSKLTNVELEVVMDNYIIQAKQQLINIAMTDEETIRAEIDSLDSYGYNLLHYCCTNNFMTLIPELLKKGAQINEKTAEGFTPLHLAAASGHSEIVELLIDHGADISAVDNDGETIVDAAANNGHETLANRLEEIAKSRGQSTPRKGRAGSIHRKNDGSGGLMSGHVGSLSDLEAENPNSSRMLQEAFSSLSLTDKVALSMTENQSVISEMDKESLRHAMKLMGPKELLHVEEEVKKIQNNVRGWILRKNYISLREATKTLQVAWREKKAKSVHLNGSTNNPNPLTSSSSSRPDDLINNRNGNNSLRSNFLDAKTNSKTLMAFDPDSFANGDADDEDAASALINLSRFNSNNSDVFVNDDINNKTTGMTFASNDGRPGLTRFTSVNVGGRRGKNPFFVSNDNADDHGSGGIGIGIGSRENSAMSVETSYRQNSLTLPDEKRPDGSSGNHSEQQERAAVKLQALFRKIKAQDRNTPYRNALKQMHASAIIQRSLKRWISNSRNIAFQPPTPLPPGNSSSTGPRRTSSFPTSFPAPPRTSSFPMNFPPAQTDAFEGPPLTSHNPFQIGSNNGLPNPPVYSSGFSPLKPGAENYRMDSMQSELFDEILAIPDNNTTNSE